MEQYTDIVIRLVLIVGLVSLTIALIKANKDMGKASEALDKLVHPDTDACPGPSEDIVEPTEDWRQWTPLTEVELVYPDGTGASFELIGNHSSKLVEDRIAERCAIDHHIPDKIVITSYRNGDKNKGGE